MELKIHHIGYLVKRMDKALAGFETLGYKRISDIVFDNYRSIDICFVEKDGYVIELISPKGKESVVSALMKKLGNSPYHLCYECDDLENTEIELKNKGYVQWDKAHEAIAFSERRVSFLMHPFLGMIELLEK